MTNETEGQEEKPAQRNILWYDDFVPKHMKGEFCEIPEALPAVMKAMLFAFIEDECENSEVPYQPKPEQWSDTATYRGLKFGHVCIGKDEQRVIDLYWWFKHESPDLLKEVVSDFRKTFGGLKFFANSPETREQYVPGYKSRFTKEQLLDPEEYIGSMDQEKLIELVKISPTMWS